MNNISRYILVVGASGKMTKKWSGTCHVFRVDTQNGKNWRPLGEQNGALSVNIQENLIRTYEDNKNIEEVINIQCLN